MEIVIFMGLQGAGKSSFFKQRFFQSHVRISLDLLKTRHREMRLLEVCLATGQRVVVDNTNPTCEERVQYIKAARLVNFRIIGFYFQSKIEDCLIRNRMRNDSERVPDVAVLSTASRIELPHHDEGFDELFYVRLNDGRYVVEEWRDEVR